MPLSPPTAQRTRMHLRSVQLDGYKRGDGYWDIESRLVDSKDHDYPLSSGLRKKCKAVRDMQVRVTINQEMNILAAVACRDATPYVGYCERIASDYSRLVGLNLFHDFRTVVKNLFHRTHGCSQISELLISCRPLRCRLSPVTCWTTTIAAISPIRDRPLPRAGMAFGRSMALLSALVP